ncbi:MAG: alpha/beta fold hydrolase [Alphaproteobacteria bacterium]|nr:alpha/beta fold hydrolase [Alphaproteobacteria bacterium]
MSDETITFPARDGRLLAGTLFRPSGAGNGIALQINGATGVRRRFYASFAAYLAKRGFHVLTFDYRGIGDSATGSLKAEKARMLDWATLDAPGASDHLQAIWPGARAMAIGHSFGGQILGLADSAKLWQRGLLIGAQHGYWRHWPRRRWPLLLLLWKAISPASIATLGFFAGRLVGMANLPPRVGAEWTRWCLSPHYVSDERGQPLRPYNHLLRVPLRFLSFADDGIAPRRAVEALLDYYPNAERQHIHLAPAEIGAEALGHFGFFRPDGPIAAWGAAADWLMAEGP